MNYKTFGVVCLMVAGLIIGVVAYHNSQRSQVPIVFSPRDVLTTLWNNYKADYIQNDPNQPDGKSGRTVDPQNGGRTTSEGESYTMLRAAWIDDQATFDRSWAWTKDNLQQKDGLFSWLYGKEPDGSYGILTQQGGQNSASDADSDIALSLLFAYARWQNPSYLSDAKQVINGIWSDDVVTVAGTPYLAADNLEKTSTAPTMAVNPSYFAPYAYRVFASVDPAHPWNKLIDSSYAVLKTSIESPLDKTQSAGLPPNWVLINRTSGQIEPATGANATSDYTFDAMRVPWRVALDWEWNRDPRAKAILSAMQFLQNQWQSGNVIDAGYSHDGQVVDNFQAPAMYGASLGYFLVNDAQDANAIYQSKIISLYNPDTNAWKSQLSYYDDNWAWFGLALYYNSLPNIAEGIVQDLPSGHIGLSQTR